uniref:Uncharacterized protein n=1 Tax=Eiseniibacteriota bacterium TaxID=2212470 RepID=A0A832I2E9_UNCEI
MNQDALLIAAVLAGVVAVALFLRRGRDERVGPPGDADEAADGAAARDDAASGPLGGDARLVLESDGHVWLPGLRGLRRVWLGSEDADPALTAAGYLSREEFEKRRALARLRGDSAGLLGDTFQPGDFTAARVVRGAAGAEPWRLEALGPDGEYVSFGFETQSSAEAALGLLEEHGVVRRPPGEDGEPVPASPGDFEEARRRAEETELALGAEPPLDEDRR